jgi:hypothetical protein
MKKVAYLAMTAVLASTLVLPSAVSAQKKGKQNERIERRDAGQAGPKFCRSGAGHPVFGREWCNDKGFGLGNRRGEDRYGDDDGYDEDGYDDGVPYGDERRDNDRERYENGRGRADPGAERWERVDWGDVRFRFSGALPGRQLNQGQLDILLGSRVTSRLTRHAYDQRVEGEFRGAWLDSDPLVLRVYAGRVPVAEFIDRDGDRRVDTVRLAYWY